MTIDKQKLKALAQAVADLEDIPERKDEHAEAVDALWLHMHCHTILALLAEIERLESGLNEMIQYRDNAANHMRRIRAEATAFQKERDQLKTENEALRKDAERYRWLRERDLETISHGGVFAGITPQNMVINLEDLDSAVDKAMSKEAK